MARLHEVHRVPRSQVEKDDLSWATVAVVDDDPNNREILARRLGRLGCRVLLAADGNEALDLLRTWDVDLVLLDIMMPGIDGIEVLARMKASPPLRHIPVIMISAATELDWVVRCIELGAEDHLPKPFNRVLLRARKGPQVVPRAAAVPIAYHARDRMPACRSYAPACSTSRAQAGKRPPESGLSNWTLGVSTHLKTA